MTKKQEQQKIQNELLHLSFLVLKYSKVYTRNTLYKKYKDQTQYISIRRINQTCKKYNLSMLSEQEYKTGLVYDTMTQDEFIFKSTSVHGCYDYSETKYLKSHDKVNIICPLHGEFQQMAYSHLQGRGCPRCITSGPEKEIKEFITPSQDTESEINKENLKSMWSNPLVSKTQISEKLGVSLHVLDTFKKKYNLGKKITSRKGPSRVDLEVYPEHEIRSSRSTFYGTKKLYNLDNRSKYSFEYMCDFYGIKKSDFINQTERTRESNKIETPGIEFIKNWNNPDLMKEDLQDIYGVKNSTLERFAKEYNLDRKTSRTGTSRVEKELLEHINPYKDLNLNDMIEDWKSSKITVKEMSKKYNLSDQVIARRMKPYGYKKRSRKPKQHDLDQYLDDIKTMYQGNYSYQEIQDKYSVGLVVLKRFAKEYNLGKKQKPNRNIPQSTKEYIKQVQKVHPGSDPGSDSSKYCYDLVDYKNTETKIEIICPEHGPWKTLPSNHLYRKSGCPRCVTSGPEKEIRENLPGTVSVVSGDRTILDGKEIDVLVKDYSFGIEYNGLMWHSIGSSKYSRFHREDTTENRTKHLNKTNLAEKKGIQLFHIFENEWLDPVKNKIWKSVINNKLKRNQSIMARKCVIKSVNKKECDIFEDLNHLQGRGTASIRLGLYYHNELVQIMTFSKGRMISSDSEYEMIRTCSLLDHHVQGGSSKLFKYFIKMYKPETITSFANRRWSQGGLYKQLGFELSHISRPCYFYFKSKVLYNRVSFQKHKLKKKLEHFDPDLTEWENMDRNGYRKIYDCGNYVYKYSMLPQV